MLAITRERKRERCHSAGAILDFELVAHQAAGCHACVRRAFIHLVKKRSTARTLTWGVCEGGGGWTCKD